MRERIPVKRSSGVRACLAMLVAFNLSGCLADDLKPPTDWREDCVGRLALSLPGDSETAVDSISSIVRRGLLLARNSAVNTAFAFADDVEGWTDLNQGKVGAISPPLTPDQMAKLRAWKEERRQKNIKKFKGRISPVEKPYDLSIIPSPSPSMLAEHQVIDFDYVIELGDRVVEGSYPLEVDEPESNKRAVAKVFASVMPRAMFEVPNEPGLCYPYVFFKDDGSLRRFIAMDYRSKARPDFHVVLWDSTAANPDKEGIDPSNETSRRNTWRNKEPDRAIASFWDQRQFDGAIVSEWLIPRRKVEMDSRAGLQSFVRLERPNGTVDYEYYAVVRGDPKAKDDTPDVMLYVYTRNEYGKKKGLAPLPKEEFLKMAQTVAASVRRRPLQ